MAKRNLWLGILVMVLVFGMTIVGCDDGSTNGAENSGENNPIGNNPGGVSAPSVPTGVKIVYPNGGPRTWGISWNSVSGATNYYVYRAVPGKTTTPTASHFSLFGTSRAGDGNWKADGGSSSLSGVTFYYYVVAENSGGKSPQSSIVSITCP
jgi:hypothetical protein